MTYVKTNWTTETPINTTNLNKIEEGIANAVETDSEARVSNVVSRNLANANNYLLGHINMSNGGIDVDNNWAYTKVKVKPNTQYTYQLTSTEDQEYEVAQYQSNGTYIVGDYGNWASGKQSYTFTTSNNVDYIFIAWRNDLNHSNIQVEEGPVVTDYVPYLNLEEAMQGTAETNKFIKVLNKMKCLTNTSAGTTVTINLGNVDGLYRSYAFFLFIAGRDNWSSNLSCLQFIRLNNSGNVGTPEITTIVSSYTGTFEASIDSNNNLILSVTSSQIINTGELDCFVIELNTAI